MTSLCGYQVSKLGMLLAFVSSAGLLVAQATQPAAPEDAHPATVTLPFVVDNAHSRPITQSDISLFDNKEPVQRVLAVYTPNELPLRLGLLIDTSNSQRSSRLYAAVIKAAFAFLNQALSGPDSKGFIITFDTKPHATAFMNRDELMKVMLNLRPGGASATYDAIYLACTERMRTESLSTTRRVLVLLTDGDDNASNVTRSEAIAAAQNAGTVIFAVSTDDGLGKGNKTLELVASETGGTALSGQVDVDMPRLFAKIKTQIENLFGVTYVPADSSKAGQFRSVEIKLTSFKHAKVHAPAGYHAVAAR